MSSVWMPKLHGDGPLYRQIVTALAAAIEGGELRPGDRLPTQREMAWQLKVNLSTVTKAYQEAARRHLLNSQVARGTFVLASSHEAKLFSLKDVPASVVDLSTSVPVLPEDDGSYAEAITEVARDMGRALCAYPNPHLIETAKMAISKWLAWRGFECSADNVLPCSGAHGGLLATMLSLRTAHAPVLVESFTFPGMKAVARQLGLRLVPVECDEQGMKPASLLVNARATGAFTAVIVANLQNPTGTSMETSRRSEIAAVAAEANIVIVEDDVYGPLTDQPPLSTELGDRGILIGSLSKSVLPGLRFGFVAGGASHLASLNEDIHTASWLAAPLGLAVASKWILDGTAMRRAAWQRGEILERWGMMTRVLGRSQLAPGPHVWLETPDTSDEDIVSLCRTLGVEVVPASVFSTGHQKARRIRICLTTPPTRYSLSIALERLAHLGLRVAL
jgi:DNA-binding transcriptional MocR family regulator